LALPYLPIEVTVFSYIYALSRSPVGLAVPRRLADIIMSALQKPPTSSSRSLGSSRIRSALPFPRGGG